MDLKKRTSSFRLVGNVKLTKNTFTLNEENSKKTWIKNNMYLGVDCGEGNVVYASMNGGFSPDNGVVYVTGKKENGRSDYSNRFQIDWEDRNDRTLWDDIGDDNFIRITLETDVNDQDVEEKFLTEYDAIQYLSENLKDGQKVCVVGKLEVSSYGVKKVITGLYKTYDERENEATFTQTILLNSDCIGKLNKDTQTVGIFGHIAGYVGKVKGIKIGKTVAFPVSLEYDVSKLIDEPDKIKEVLSVLFGVKKGCVRELDVQGSFIEGVAYKQLTIEDLPKEIKFLIKIGSVNADEILKGKVVKSDENGGKRMVIKVYAFKKVTDEEGNVKQEIHCDDKTYKPADLITYEEALEQAGVESEELAEIATEDAVAPQIPEDLFNQLFQND